MASSLTFVIHPEGQELSLELFQKTIDDVRRLIRDIDYTVTRERGKRRWVIQALHSSAPTITIRPLLKNDELVEIIVNGIEKISKGTLEPPLHFNEPTLEDLRRMRRLFKGKDKAKSIEFVHDGKPATIGRDIGEKVERILKGGYSALGSIEGSLEALNLHGSPTFTIWDRVSKMPIRCHFPKDRSWVDKVQHLLEKRVLVRGRVNFFTNGIPRSIVSIEDIIDETPNPELPRAKFGSLSADRPPDIIEFLKRTREGV